MEILYVYAIGQSLDRQIPRDLEGVDGSRNFTIVSADGLDALCSMVDGDAFSQEEIDRRGSDLAWLGDIGYRHQRVISTVAAAADVIPLRAFTLFSHSDSLREYLRQESDSLRKVLEAIKGKEEWTLRFEFDHERWFRALVHRIPSLRTLSEQVAQTSTGRGYLLKKKLEEERKKAARTAEEELLAEADREVNEKAGAKTVIETREQRSGSFPQMNILIDRSRAGQLQKTHEEMARRYEPDGVKLVLTGPWPPYSFTS